MLFGPIHIGFFVLTSGSASRRSSWMTWIRKSVGVCWWPKWIRDEALICPTWSLRSNSPQLPFRKEKCVTIWEKKLSCIARHRSYLCWLSIMFYLSIWSLRGIGFLPNGLHFILSMHLCCSTHCGTTMKGQRWIICRPPLAQGTTWFCWRSQTLPEITCTWQGDPWIP